VIDLTPDEFRRLGYRAVDIVADMLHGLADGPCRTWMPDERKRAILSQPVPRDGTEPDLLLDRVVREVVCYSMGNGSPRFFGWVNSPAAPLAVLGDLIASGLNPSVAGGDHSGTYVEHAVLTWIKQLVGFSNTSGAILTSGGSVANLIGLAVMRHTKTLGQVRTDGLCVERRPLVVYASTECHSCVQKAMELLGFGSRALRKIAVDRDFRMDVNMLADAIQADRTAGLIPVCVAASAGTVNTGAVDPLAEIADVCAAAGLWFHVDAAYGGPGILAEAVAGEYAGMERADSLAVDPHKWLYIPVECGCALVRDAGAMRQAFSLVPPYLEDPDALPWFSEFGIQQTRGFRALKLWLALQHVGIEGYRRLITRDIALARTLRDMIRESNDFALCAAGPLSVVCFQHVRPEHGDDVKKRNEFNRQVLAHVQREGRVFLTGTELNGRFVLRACIVNFRTSENDLVELLTAIRRAGQKLLEGA
jgi:glutamate/tyrosine decarboxylase-like PLP-dependent enzyme